ncbi:hypothetical protein [Aeromonas hydrophila]|uniref:hypothetical protein n=1 Tax=Aeromonas hydrophila TaxID=644 RepID=UPI00126A2F31|nr:hypothetical protein [Aeromonas hydrophila]
MRAQMPRLMARYFYKSFYFNGLRMALGATMAVDLTSCGPHVAQGEIEQTLATDTPLAHELSRQNKLTGTQCNRAPQIMPTELLVNNVERDGATA